MFILFTLSIKISATTYYISSSQGDDYKFNGLSPSTPWKTIDKVNSAFSIFKPGDRILFNRGDIFYGNLIVSKSGTESDPLFIGSYGAGNKPIISGFTQINSWNTFGSGIYSKAIPLGSVPNMVVFDGVNTPVGRWPNSGWRYYEYHNNDVSITDNELTDDPDWAGAELVILKDIWIIEKKLITDHTNTKLIYSPNTGSQPIDKHGYFIQKSIKCLDLPGEWFYDSNNSTFYMYFGSSIPTDHTVKVSSIDKLISLTSQNFITIDNIKLEGANLNAIASVHSNNIVIQNCEIDFSGSYGIYSSNWSTNHLIENCTINQTNNIAIEYYNFSNNVTIRNCNIFNTGLNPGMLGNVGSGDAIIFWCDNSTAEYNQIINTGYIGIFFRTCSNVLIKNNFIKNFCLIKDDGGGIYTGRSELTKNNIITGNIVINGGVGSDLGHTGFCSAHGIYLDANSSEITVSYNTCINNSYGGIFLSCGHNNILEYNKCFENTYTQILFRSFSGYDLIRNNKLNYNELIANNTNKLPVLSYRTDYEDISNFGIADDNIYGRPIDNSDFFQTYQPSTGYKFRTLTGWQTISGQDINSRLCTVEIKDTADINCFYNSTKANKVIVLEKPMIDVKGTKYQSSVTLLPYTSAILMVDPNPAPPEIPVYTTSVIENTTPSLLEMTYNLPLTNSVPAASAFNVVVNSVARSVSSVSVSGNKVLLTLSNPVVFGNVVTVAYTKPAVNPIKTTSGGEAASMEPQPVTNKVSSGIPVYLSSVVENLTPNLLEITFDLNLSESIIPPPTVFNVLVNSSTRTINNISISGNKVRLTLSTPVVYADAITIAYTKPASGGLQTSSGGEVATFSVKIVTNNVGPVAPVFVSAVVENATPTNIDLSYSLSLANIVPAVTAFILTVNSSSRSISTVSIVSGKVRLTLPTPLSFGDIITISYVKPSINPLQTSSGGQAESISGKSVTNNISPAVPVYTSSVIEDATPGIIEMTYNLALANIIPDISAFSVQVNSTSRSINSVSISSGKVRLSLSSNVVYGDIITVSYTKPAVNPLQTPSGGQAASISLQPVTNKCFNPSVPNKLPVIDILQNEPEIFSGFVYELDASATYDPDGDPLTYSWDVPAQIPVSSTNNLKIQFLAPVVSSPQVFNLTLNVNDGRDIVSKTISVTIDPYKPELGISKIDLIEASNYVLPDQPDNVNDGNLSTKWSIDGDNQWLTMKLLDPFKINHIQVALLPDQKYISYFDILASRDNILWEPIFTKASSCSFSGNLQNFDFPVEKNSISYSFIKLVGHGNSLNNMNNYSEIKLFGTLGERSSNPALQPENISIYPNPATDFINVLILEPPSETQLLRIFDYSGVLRFTENIESGVNNVQIPINLFPGAYVAQVLLGKIIVYAKPLIVL